MANMKVTHGRKRDYVLNGLQALIDSAPEAMSPNKDEALRLAMSLRDKISRAKDGDVIELSEEEARAFKALQILMKMAGMDLEYPREIVMGAEGSWKKNVLDVIYTLKKPQNMNRVPKDIHLGLMKLEEDVHASPDDRIIINSAESNKVFEALTMAVAKAVSETK